MDYTKELAGHYTLETITSCWEDDNKQPTIAEELRKSAGEVLSKCIPNAFDRRAEEVNTFEPISSKEAETSINGYKEYK